LPTDKCDTNADSYIYTYAHTNGDSYSYFHADTNAYGHPGGDEPDRDRSERHLRWDVNNFHRNSQEGFRQQSS
jgi:hypothetical protein